jgi:hypothetical protein
MREVARVVVRHLARFTAPPLASRRVGVEELADILRALRHTLSRHGDPFFAREQLPVLLEE